MFGALSSATASSSSSFSWTGLVIVAVVVAIIYPVQKRLRARLSQQRRARWAELEERESDVEDGRD
ncbi:MAG: hypothetical protein ABIS35_13610 [Terracoccus sp.]